MLGLMKTLFQKIKHQLKNDSCLELISLINVLPKFAGIPLLDKKNNVLFWIVHATLSFYVYIVGTAVYQMYYAEGLIDYINSFFNISILILIIISSSWMLLKRTDLHELLRLVQKNDDLVKESGRVLEKHRKLMRNIKIVILSCYTFHFVNDVLIFIPSRTLDMNQFSVASCVGLEPLHQTPNKEICMLILTCQELTSIVVVSSYDVTLLFLFGHTTAIFQILCEDMSSLKHDMKSFDNYIEITDRLKNLAIRHSSVLHTANKLQKIYSNSIGVGFGLNAISVCLFFVLPLEVCLNFRPLIYYIISVFFLYCYQGQRLTTASEGFEKAVYNCGWESMRVKEQKLMLLILKQAQKPVVLHAAGIVSIKIYTFAYTMQSIYKFVAIFKL